MKQMFAYLSFKRILALIILLAGSVVSQGATIVWTNAATAIWTNPVAWNPNGPPVSANDYVCSGNFTMQSIDGATSTFTNNSVMVRSNATIYFFRTNGGTSITVNDLFTNTVAGTVSTLTVSNATIKADSSLGTVVHRIKTPVTLLGTNLITYGNTASYTVDLYLDSTLTGSGSVNVNRSSSGTYKQRDLYLTGNCSGFSGSWTNTGVSGTVGAMNMYAMSPSGWGSGGVTLNAYATLTVSAAITNPAPRVTLSAATATFTVSQPSTIGSLSGVASSTATVNNTLTLADNTSAVFAGNMSGSGSLIKNGTGSLTVGSINLTGPATINAGTFIAAGSVGGLTLTNGTTLAPGSAALTAGTLTVNGDLNLSTNNLNLDLSNNTSSGNDVINVSGNLNLNGVIKVNLNLLNGNTAPGPYTVITYNGTANGGATNFQVVGSRTATFDFSTQNQVNLWFTNGGAMNLTWVGDGTNNAWDAGISYDWFDGAAMDFFAQGDNVTFNDSATNLTVNVTNTVSPNAFNVATATNNYVITGTGVIGGGTTLLKSGTATLTISNANAWSGGTTISAGVIDAKNSTALGTGTVTLSDANTGTTNTALYLGYAQTLTNAIVAAANGSGTEIIGGDQAGGPSGTSTSFTGPITLNGALTIDSGSQLDRLHVGGAITGTGNLTLQGGHRIDLGGANTFNGNVYIQGAGTLFETFGATCVPSTATVDVGAGSTFGVYIGVTIAALTDSGLVEPYGASSTLTVGANSGNGTFSGIITNNAALVLSLTKTSGGTQTLNGPDYATGTTTINGGTLAIGASGSISNSATINVASGATFDVSALGGTFALNPGQTLAGLGSVNGSFNTLSNAVISPAGSGVPGTLTFNNNLTLLGGTVLSLDLTNTTTPGSGINDLIVVSGNLNLNGTNIISLPALTQQALVPGTYQLINYSGALSGAATNFVVSPVLTRLTLTVDTSTAGQVNLIVSGSSASSLVWNGGLNTNAWDVATTLNWLNGGNPDVFYQQDGVLFSDAGGANSNVLLTTTLYPSAVTVSSSSNYVFYGSGKLTGSIGLTKAGTGTLTISNANSYTGNTTINGGTLQLNNAGGVGTGTIAVGNNTLGVNIAGSTVTNPITGTGNINVTETASANTAFSGDMSSFTGALNLPASPGGTAKTAITSANVNLNSAATINITNGGTFYTSVSIPSAINLAGSGNTENLGALRIDGAITMSGPITLLGYATIGDNTSGATITGAIGDGGHGYGWAKMGGYTLTLAGNNTYTGMTTVSNGTVNVTGDESAATGGWTMPINAATATVNFQSGSTIIVSNNAYIQVGSSPANGTPNVQTLNANGIVTNNGSLLVARGGYVNINSGALWVQNGGLTNSPPTGSGYAAYIEINPGGTLIYNGTNTIKLEPSSGNTGYGSFTNEGTVITSQGFERTINTSSANPLLQLNGGTIQLSANIAALTSSSLVTTGGVLTVQMAGAGGTIDTAGFSTTISNVVSGAGSLTKISPGTLWLPFTNTYTGATYVNGGTLGVNGKLAPASSVTFAAGTTLTGTGNIGGPTMFMGGSLVQPGNGTLTVSNVTFGSSTADFVTNAFNVTAGGNLATTTLTINGTNIVNILDASLAVGSYNLISYTGAINGNGISAFVLGTLPAHTAGYLQDSGTAVQLVVTSTINTTPTNLVAQVSGTNLNLSWPADHTGWRLQVQTNSLRVGVTTNNWYTWPNSTNVDSVAVPINQLNPTVFFRLVYP